MNPTGSATGFEREIDRLADEFAGIYSRETIARCLVESSERLPGAGVRVTEYLHLLAYRFARERLVARAQVEGSMEKLRPSVLFVCVHNAGRSQMAAVLTAHLSRGAVDVRSAGSDPGERINPRVAEAMAELGLDLSQEFPKPLTDEAVEAADVVVTMGCGDACPVYPGKQYLDWTLNDPAGQPIDVVRRIRDEIADHVRALVAELVPA